MDWSALGVPSAFLAMGGASGSFFDAAGLLASAGAAVACARRGHREQRSVRRAWYLLAASAVVWGMAASIRLTAGHEAASDWRQAAVLALAALLAIVALSTFHGAPARARGKARTLVDGLIVAGSSLFIAWVAGLDDLLGARPDAWQLMVIGEALGWVALASSATVMLTRARPAARPALALVAAGFAGLAVADGAAAYEALGGSAEGVPLLGAGWMGGWALIGLAALRRATELRGEELEPGLPTQASVLVPSVPFAAGVLAGAAAAARGELEPLLIWDGAAVVVLIVLRQVLALLENISFWRDLQSRIEARTKDLERSEARFRSLVQNASDVITVIGPDGALGYQSASTAAVFGWQPHELGAHAPLSLLHPDDLERVVALARGLRDEPGGTRMVECRVRHKDGSWRDVEAIASNLLADPAVAGFVVNTRDVTERKRTHDALRKSRERLQAILDHTPAAIYMKDLGGRYVLVNRRAASIFRMEEAGVVGRTDQELFPAELAQRFTAMDRRTLRSGEPVSTEQEIETDDGPRTFLAQEFPLRDLAGGVYAICGICTDITERVRVEQKNRRLEEELHQGQRLEMVGRLAGGIAHDFNNLLAVILNYAALAREQLPESSAVGADLDEIQGAAGRAADLTGELLAFSRRGRIDPSSVDLNAVVGDAQRILRRTIGEDIALSIDLDPQLWSIEADAGQLERVLLNLAVNARHAMPQGGILTMRTKNVELKGNGTGPAGTAPGRYVRLTVSDTGCGMTEDVAARAFDPFFTTKPVGEGTGLGLATVYGIVKQAGGDLALDSRAGSGTTVTLYLPASEAPAVPRTRRAPSRPAPADGQVVLVVEDEASVRRLISRVLSRNGYVVEEAASSPEALGACSNPDRRLDLVLTDVVMPAMSGGELAEHARRIRPNLNVLFMSGYPDDVRLRHGIPAGQPYLQKPFTSGELLNHVAATLRAEPHRRRRAGGLRRQSEHC